MATTAFVQRYCVKNMYFYLDSRLERGEGSVQILEQDGQDFARVVGDLRLDVLGELAQHVQCRVADNHALVPDTVP